jgi:hypothetical protein
MIPMLRPEIDLGKLGPSYQLGLENEQIDILFLFYLFFLFVIEPPPTV